MDGISVLRKQLLDSSFRKLLSLRQANNLQSAALCKKTGYNKIWIRDNIYQALGMQKISIKQAIKTYRAILTLLKKYEWKIDNVINNKPKELRQYLHPVYNLNMEELKQEWGFKQNDAIGAILFHIGDLELRGIKVLKNQHDKRIVEKLVLYLKSIEYWHDPDNGIWEENMEIHASSIGACVAGLKKISKIVHVPKFLIKNGERALKNLLPRESETKDVDMALLSLIYPYNIVSKKTAEIILKNVEEKLVRKKGVIRYLGDQYYNRNGEAEWTMGFPWLAVIYKNFNNPEKYAYYTRKTLEAMNDKGELPELYFANSDEYNENTPLGWAQAMMIVALS